MLKPCWVLFFLILTMVPLPGNARSPILPAVVRTTLSNGLRVVIVRTTLAPVAVVEMNYLAGSNEAPAGFPGTAHALEHMMFRGSPGLSANQLSEITAAIGGNCGARTLNTITQYYCAVPAQDIGVAIRIAAIRMRGLDVTQSAWKKERSIIDQEVAQKLSNPSYLLFTKLSTVMFSGTPYAYSPLGTQTSFDKTTAKLIKAFYAKWYAPNNAILLLVGDVDPQYALNLIQEQFSDIPRKVIPTKLKINLKHITDQTLRIPTDEPYGLSVVAFRFPGYDGNNYAASQILVEALDDARSIFHSPILRTDNFLAGFEARFLPQGGIGFAASIFHKGEHPGASTKGINNVIKIILKKGIPRDLILSAKRHAIAQVEFQKNSIGTLAQSWSTALALQGLESPDRMITAYRMLTVAGVNRVAREVLNQHHSVTVILTPQRSTGLSFTKSPGATTPLSAATEKIVNLPKWADSAFAHLKLPARTFDPTTTILPNGIRLIVQPTDISNTVSVYGRIASQPDLEQPRGQEGISELLDRLFSYGTTTLDRSAFQAALDRIAAQETAGTSFSIRAPAINFKRAVQLLAENVLHPPLRAQCFSVVQKQTAKFTSSQVRNSKFLFQRAITRALVPVDDPTLRQATPRSIMHLKLTDVRSYYNHVFRPDMTTIVVIGKVTSAEAESVIKTYFGHWVATGPKPDVNLHPIPLNTVSGQTLVTDKTKTRDTVILAETLGVNLTSPDRYSLELGNIVLGREGQASRLFRDLRQKAGLVYDVRSRFILTPSRGTFEVEYGCDPDKVTEAYSLVVRDLMEMQNKPLTTIELRLAKAFAMSNTLLGEASVQAIADGWTTRSAEGLPLDEPFIATKHYMEITAPKIQAAYKKWLRPSDLVETIMGPRPK